jgi:putative phage-type endonuclease
MGNLIAERKKGIGGTDTSGILNLSRWKSPLSVYIEKTTDISDKRSDYNASAKSWGLELEDVIAKRFQKETGFKVRKKNLVVYHKDHSELIGHLDRLVTGKNEGLEIKTANEFKSAEWRKHSIPNEYMCQCQHYMSITGFEYWWLAVLIGGQRFETYRLKRDDDFINNILTPKCIHFWNYNVKYRVPPTTGSNKIDEDFLNSIGNINNDDVKELDDESIKLARRYLSLKGLKSELEDNLKLISNRLRDYMGVNVKGEGDGIKLIYKPSSRSSLDSASIKEDDPDLYEKYKRETTSRTLLVKGR